MPFKSERQRRFFYAVATNPTFAKKAGVSKKTAKKFIKDSKRK